jgi:hypothetical protein
MHPALVILAGGTALAAASGALWVLWHIWPAVLAATVIAVACRRWQLHRRAWAAIAPRATTAEHPEVTRLRADNDQLRAALADAERARDAAWDAAASVPPRLHRADVDTRTRILADPLSGVRAIGAPNGANWQASTPH